MRLAVRPALPPDSPHADVSYDVVGLLAPLAEAAGTSLNQLATAIGCDASIVAHWQRGRRVMPGYWVPAVARRLGVAESALTGYAVPRPRAGPRKQPKKPAVPPPPPPPQPERVPIAVAWRVAETIITLGPCIDPACDTANCARYECGLCGSRWVGGVHDHRCRKRVAA